MNEVKKTLISNFSYLSLIEILGLLCPLLTYPYLIRVIGSNYYGIITFSQAIIAYVVICVNFGFNVSATRRISENRSDVNELNVIFSSIILLKLFIFIIVFALTLLVLIAIGYSYINIFCLLIGLCVQEVFFPIWFFQGLEKMKYITLVSAISRLLFVLLVFCIVRKQEDFIYVPILYTIGGFVTSLLSYLIVYYNFNIRFVLVGKHIMIKELKDSSAFFASRLSSVIMERSNIILIGCFFNYEKVAIFDLCLKILSILKTPFTLVSQVLYPSVARSKNRTLIVKSFKAVLTIGIVLSLLVGLFANDIVILLGGVNLIEAVPILRILLLYLPFVGISYIFGASTLVIFGYMKAYNLSVVYSFIFYIIFVIVIVFMGKVNLYTMAFTYIVPEIYIALYRSFIVYKHRLLNTYDN